MKKETIEYRSPLDALVTIIRRLSHYESQHNLTSEIFFERYQQGQCSDDAVFVEWANDYRHYLAIRSELEKRLEYAA